MVSVRVLIFRQGPMSSRYSHILTSCFLDTVLIPLCTWLYLLAVVVLFTLFARQAKTPYRPPSKFSNYRGFKSRKTADVERDEAALEAPRRKHGKIHLVVSILYYLLLVAQILMCVLEIVRLSLAHLGIGLLPFTIIAIVVAGMLRLTLGLQGRIRGWRWASLALWIALAVTNGIKIAEEVKEGTNERKGTKYPVMDELTDVSVMIGVYVVLGVLEVFLGA